MKIKPIGVDTDDLPTVTLDDVREQVRGGHERGISWCIQAHTNTTHESVLTMLREFTEREFLVVDEDQTLLARLQEPNPSPFPEVTANIHAECAKHMTEIRNRSGVLLNEARGCGEDLRRFIFIGLIDIERETQQVRNRLEVTLFRHYIDDEAISDENEDAYLHYARNAFGYPKYALHVLEQSLRIFMQYQELQKEK